RDTTGLGSIADEQDAEGEDEASPSATLAREAATRRGERRRFLELAARLWTPAQDELATWAQMLSPEHAEEALDRAMETPLEFAAWITLAPKHRAKALSRASSVDALLDGARTLDLSKLSTDGLELVRLLRSPDVVAMLRSPSAPDRDGGGDVRTPPPRPTTKGRPSPRDLSVQTREHVERALREASDAGQALWLRVQSKSQGDRVVCLRPERLLARGDEVAVLGTDAETEDGRSFPLANIVACQPVGRAGSTPSKP
nr:hypothetical protein [Myxococcota bacterium]